MTTTRYKALTRPKVTTKVVAASSRRTAAGCRSHENAPGATGSASVFASAPGARVVVWLAGLVLLGGCAKFELTDMLPWAARQPEPGVPSKMDAIWTSTVMNQPGKPGVRGFGGRIMFYQDDKEDPITIDGTLTVYAFGDRDKDGPERSPRRKFVFLPEHLPDHHSESALGHSYSIWIPWGQVGGTEQQVSLISRFEDHSGQVVASDPTQLLLPGRAADEPRTRHTLDTELTATGTPSALPDRSLANGQRPERPVSHQEPLPQRASAKSIETTTITVPPSFLGRATAEENVARLREKVLRSYAERNAAGQQTGGSNEATAGTSGSGPAGTTNGPDRQTNEAPTAPSPTAAEPRAIRSEPPTPPARVGRRSRLSRHPFRKRPHPAGWLSALPSTPRSGQAVLQREIVPAVEPTWLRAPLKPSE